MLSDDPRTNDKPLSKAEQGDSDMLSEASKMPINDSFQSQHYNIPAKQRLTQTKAQNGSNFTTLGKISEQKKVKIIEKGFQLQAEGKISLKKYYESTQEFSLFQLKGYSIKYESIRRTKLYSKLKEKSLEK